MFGKLKRNRNGSVLIQGLLVFFVFITAANALITQIMLRKSAQHALNAAKSVMVQHNQIIEKLRLQVLDCDKTNIACFTLTHETTSFIYTITFASDTLNVVELSIVNK